MCIATAELLARSGERLGKELEWHRATQSQLLAMRASEYR